jgi:hypothetical protein
MSRLTRARVTIAVALVAAFVAGCKREPATTPASAMFGNEPFFIRGSVTEVGKPWGTLVTGEPGTSYKIDKAYFRVTPATQVVRADGSAATIADVKVGTKITLWIAGPIMESYPVQVSAQRILIE